VADLSHLHECIPSQLCTLTYVTTDDVTLSIIQSGRNEILAKIDIYSAFHLLPVQPANQHLPGMKWRSNIYRLIIDSHLGFALHCNCSTYFPIYWHGWWRMPVFLTSSITYMTTWQWDHIDSQHFNITVWSVCWPRYPTGSWQIRGPFDIIMLFKNYTSTWRWGYQLTN